MTRLLVELAASSDNCLRDIHPTIVNGPEMDLLRVDKAAFESDLDDKYRENLAAIVAG